MPVRFDFADQADDIALTPGVPEISHAVIVPRVADDDRVDFSSHAVGLDHDGEFTSLFDIKFVAQVSSHLHEVDLAFEFAVWDEILHLFDL